MLVGDAPDTEFEARAPRALNQAPLARQRKGASKVTNNNLTKKHILGKFVPRDKAEWYERSFAIAFVPVLVVVAVALISHAAKRHGWSLSDPTSNPNLLAVPAGLVVAAVFAAAMRTNSAVQEKLEIARVASAIFRSLTREQQELEQAFFRLIMSFGRVLRDNAPQEEMLENVTALSTAYGAEKAASVNGALPKLCEALTFAVSKPVRNFPRAVSVAFWVFLSLVMIIPVFTSGVGSILTAAMLVYAFAVIFFVSQNLIQVFGTKGSQTRVSQILKDLLG